MKVLKFILITFLILVITAGIPLYVNKITSDNTHLIKVEDSHFSGPYGYVENIIADENVDDEVKDGITNFSEAYQTLMQEEKEDFSKLFLTISLILGITIIFFGILLLKATKLKLFASSVTTAGVISLISSIFIYFSLSAKKLVNKN